jgi:hypothetical protein
MTQLAPLLNGIGVAIALASTVLLIAAGRKPRPIKPLPVLGSAVWSLAVLSIFVLVSGAWLHPLIAGGCLALGALSGLVRGLSARLTSNQGEVCVRLSGVSTLLWGVALALAQLLAIRGSAAWAALGLVPLYLTTGSEFVFYGVLFIRRLS